MTRNSPCCCGGTQTCWVKSSKTCVKPRLRWRLPTTENKLQERWTIYLLPSSRLRFVSVLPPRPCSLLLHDLTRSMSLASLSRRCARKFRAKKLRAIFVSSWISPYLQEIRVRHIDDGTTCKRTAFCSPQTIASTFSLPPHTFPTMPKRFRVKQIQFNGGVHQFC